MVFPKRAVSALVVALFPIFADAQCPTLSRLCAVIDADGRLIMRSRADPTDTTAGEHLRKSDTWIAAGVSPAFTWTLKDGQCYKTVVRLWRWEAEGIKPESMPVFNIKEGDRVKFLWTPNPAVAPPALPHNIARLEPCKCGPHNLHHVCV
eukprot:8090-Heterococcus_DN1.PRE.4